MANSVAVGAEARRRKTPQFHRHRNKAAPGTMGPKLPGAQRTPSAGGYGNALHHRIAGGGTPIAVMQAGKRRTTLHDRFERDVLPLFEGRVLPFDLDASKAYAGLMARAKAAGIAIGKADGYIAATAAVRGFAVATRDTAPFEAAGLNILNPWETQR